MKVKKKTILHLLEKSGVPLSIKQLRHRLGIRKSQHLKLKAFVDSLVQQGKVRERGGLYQLLQNQTYEDLGNLEEHFDAEDSDLPFQHLPEVLTHKPEAKPVTLPPETESAKPALANELKKPGRLIGTFSKNRKGFGFVDIGDGREDVFIPEEELKTALSGDKVEVELFSRRDKGEGRRRGRITQILERGSPLMLGKLVRGRLTTMVLPINERSGLPPVYVPKEHDKPEIEAGRWVEVELLPPSPEIKGVQGRLVRGLAATSVDQLAFEQIVIENQIISEFSPAALTEAESFPQKVVYHANSGRKDLRDLPFVTIDGKTARDFDDAILVQKEGEGRYRLYVAIADVAHYVRPNQPLDQDAYRRGTSVYFPTHAIPMLPEALSNNLCSLKPNVNRLTLTCEMEIDGRGQVQNYQIYESVIRSHARLTYDEVQSFLDGHSVPSLRKPILQESLKLAWELAQILTHKRLERGSINFSFPESVVEFNEANEMVGMTKKYQSGSMKLIEQCMLEANETVARYCLEHHLPALYRVHDGPNMLKLEKLQKTFWHFGVHTKLASLKDSRQFNVILEQLREHPNRNQIEILLLRSMALACYRTTNDGHFGLAAKFYAHFTSPIRRYPDLIVHRAIKEKLEAERRGITQRPTVVMSEEVAEHLSHQERRAETAERQSMDLMKVAFLEAYVGQMFLAKVMGVESAGLLIELQKVGVECFIPLEILDRPYEFDPISLTLTGKRGGRHVKVGDRLKVQLVRVDRLQRTTEFAFEHWVAETRALDPVKR